MTYRPTAIERAFELARSGQVKNAEEIKRILRREGHSLATVQGATLIKQLRTIALAARATSEPQAGPPGE